MKAEERQRPGDYLSEGLRESSFRYYDNDQSVNDDSYVPGAASWPPKHFSQQLGGPTQGGASRVRSKYGTRGPPREERDLQDYGHVYFYDHVYTPESLLSIRDCVVIKLSPLQQYCAVLTDLFRDATGEFFVVFRWLVNRHGLSAEHCIAGGPFQKADFALTGDPPLPLPISHVLSRIAMVPEGYSQAQAVNHRQEDEKFTTLLAAAYLADDRNMDNCSPNTIAVEVERVKQNIQSGSPPKTSAAVAVVPAVSAAPIPTPIIGSAPSACSYLESQEQLHRQMQMQMQMHATMDQSAAPSQGSLPPKETTSLPTHHWNPLVAPLVEHPPTAQPNAVHSILTPAGSMDID